MTIKATAIKDSFNKSMGLSSEDKEKVRKRRKAAKDKDESIFDYLAKKFNEVKNDRVKSLTGKK